MSDWRPDPRDPKIQARSAGAVDYCLRTCFPALGRGGWRPDAEDRGRMLELVELVVLDCVHALAVRTTRTELIASLARIADRLQEAGPAAPPRDPARRRPDGWQIDCAARLLREELVYYPAGDHSVRSVAWTLMQACLARAAALEGPARAACIMLDAAELLSHSLPARTPAESAPLKLEVQA